LWIGVHDVDWPQYDDPFAAEDLPFLELDLEERLLLRDVLRDVFIALTPRLRTAEFDPFALGFFVGFMPAGSNADTRVRRRFEQRYVGVDSEGLLYVDDRQLARLTIGDLRRAGESGYTPGVWNRLVIFRPEGLGGGEALVDLAAFINNIGVSLVATSATWMVKRAVTMLRRGRQDREARRLAGAWVAAGLDEPWRLLRWLDFKGTWDAVEVARRLGLSTDQAEELLRAAGYEWSRELARWTFGTSWKAKRRRRHWMRQARLR